MSAAFPKYSKFICNTYPDNGFIASSEKCTLQTGNAIRSRLSIGGTFFRSAETSGVDNVNGIKLSCTVVFDSTVGDEDIYIVTFNYTDANGAAQTPIIVSQKYDTVLLEYSLNGIGQLRSALSGNSIVTMPSDDSIIAPAGAGSGFLDATDDSDHITAFTQTSMAGGGGLPAGDASIRTGPTYSLFFIVQEDTAADGTWVDVNAASEWNGSSWESHPSQLYDIECNDGVRTITPDPGCAYDTTC